MLAQVLGSFCLTCSLCLPEEQKNTAQSTSPTVEGCRKNKGLRISCHQVRFLAVPYTSWVTLGKLLNRSEHMFLICKVRLIISKCWLIVRIVDNVHKTQNVFSKHRRSMINIVFLYFLFWWKFCDLLVLEQIEPLWVSQSTADCVLLTILSCFWQLHTLAFCFGNSGFSRIVFHICQLR